LLNQSCGNIIQVFFNNATGNQKYLNNEGPHILLIMICCSEKYGTTIVFVEPVGSVQDAQCRTQDP